MKHLRKLAWLVSACLIVNSVPPKARAQQIGNEQATGQIVDTWISVMSMAYPEAAPFLETGKKLFDMLDVFGKPDATGEALKKINERLDRIEKRISDLDAKINALRNDFFREKNYTRLQLLRTKRELLQGLAIQLQEKPTQPDAKRGLVKAVQNIADDFLDPELWQWSDMRRSDDQMVDPDFKPLPTLELYTTTLVTWMAAISYAGGDSDYVKRNYGPALQRHINYLNQTLTANIRTRVSARIDNIDKYPKNRVCAYEVFIDDKFRHLAKDAGPGQVQMPSNNVMCQVPEAMGHVALEGEMQRAYGIDVMEAVSAKLDRLRAQGTLAEQFTGTFDPQKYQSEGYLYAVKPNGELVWYWHVVVTKPKAPEGNPRILKTERQSPDMRKVTTTTDSKVGGNAAQGPIGRMRDQGVGSTRQDAGTTQNPEKIFRPGVQSNAPPAVDVTHLLQGPKLIGTGWEQFKDVMPAGKGSIYALTADGTLKWYRNDTPWNIVGGEPGSPKLQGPIDIGNGWQTFIRIVPAADGILYAITSDGALQWYKHGGYLDGTMNWSGPIDVSPTRRSPLGPRFSQSWAGFKQVFSGGEGVMYAITNDGVLQWYRHQGYLTGTRDWDGPRNVGTGWQDFTRVFSPGDGVIYAMKPTGEVLWYKHVGYKDGTVSWQGPVEIAADWKDFIFVFPQMSGTWTPPVIN